MDNHAIADALYELAELLEYEGAAGWRPRAFRQAARAVESLPEPAAALLARGALTDVPGIGPGTARRVAELVATGRLVELEARRRRNPRALLELTQVEGLGPRGAEQAFRALGVESIEALEAAARDGRLAALPRFGAKRAANIAEAIARRREATVEWRRDRALADAAHLIERLRGLPGVLRVELAGSARRGREMVGGLDLLAAAAPADAPSVAERFAALPPVRAVAARGDAHAAVRLRDGLRIDLRVVPPESWGAALHWLTGSKAHNLQLRALAARRGLDLDEHGRFASEEEVFAAVGLPWIPPELREGAGELEAAAAGALPSLVTRGDLRGDLHVHTVESDGRATLEEMALAARAAGHEYIAITDHSQNLAIANGLDGERLRAQGAAIAALNRRLGGRPVLLRGVEADILPDGTVDLGPAVLGELDWVVASVHSHFRMPRGEQTARVVRALASGLVDCLGHPTGRLLGRRAGVDLDLDAVLAAARDAGAAVELNAFPDRIDLAGEALRRARALGVMVAIDTDSHAPSHFAHLRHGVTAARRGWLEPRDVVNALPLAALRARFGHHHRRVA